MPQIGQGGNPVAVVLLSCDLAWPRPQGVLRQLEYQLEQACVEDEKGHLDVAMGMYSRAVETALQGVGGQHCRG